MTRHSERAVPDGRRRKWHPSFVRVADDPPGAVAKHCAVTQDLTTVAHQLLVHRHPTGAFKDRPEERGEGRFLGHIRY